MMGHAALRDGDLSTRGRRRVGLFTLACALLMSAVSAPAQSTQATQATQATQSSAAIAADAAKSASAAAVVESLHAVLSENLLDGDAQGFDARIARLGPVVARSFDFQAIARVAAGRFYASMGAAERARFERLLEDLSVTTYADQFSGAAAPERFVFVSEQQARGGRILVRTHLERPDDAPVALDYLLQNSGQALRIVNVIADGVSDLSLKRAQYASVLQTEGVSVLLERIEQQLLQLQKSARSGG